MRAIGRVLALCHLEGSPHGTSGVHRFDPFVFGAGERLQVSHDTADAMHPVLSVGDGVPELDIGLFGERALDEVQIVGNVREWIIDFVSGRRREASHGREALCTRDLHLRFDARPFTVRFPLLVLERRDVTERLVLSELVQGADEKQSAGDDDEGRMLVVQDRFARYPFDDEMQMAEPADDDAGNGRDDRPDGPIPIPPSSVAKSGISARATVAAVMPAPRAKTEAAKTATNAMPSMVLRTGPKRPMRRSAGGVSAHPTAKIAFRTASRPF